MNLDSNVRFYRIGAGFSNGRPRDDIHWRRILALHLCVRGGLSFAIFAVEGPDLLLNSSKDRDLLTVKYARRAQRRPQTKL